MGVGPRFEASCRLPAPVPPARTKLPPLQFAALATKSADSILARGTFANLDCPEEIAFCLRSNTLAASTFAIPSFDL